MSFLTLELKLEGRRALVLGGQGEIVSKIDRLLEAGALVTVIVPPSSQGELAALKNKYGGGAENQGHLELLCRQAAEEDFAGHAIVFAAPGDDELSRALFDYGLRTGTPVCTLDRPEFSTFINPAVASVSGLRISVGTQGTSPSLAKRIREDLEALFAEPMFSGFLSKLAELRAALPRGERAQRMKEAVEGFRIEARLHLPSWAAKAKDGEGRD